MATQFKFEDVLIGRTTKGERIYISAETRLRTGDYRTIDHRQISSYQELAISGLAVEPRRRMDNAYAAGQILSELKEITRPVNGLTVADIQELEAIWERWHLNGMRALCIHQSPLYESSKGYRRLDLETIGICEAGYSAGSSWLVEELPDDIAAKVQDILNRAK